MKMAAAVVANDVRLQVRYGLYAVSLVMVLFWGLLLGALVRTVELPASLLVPPFVALNLIITTFYFMAALVLFEKGEGVLPALVVTPLTSLGYLLSKAFSLALLATAESLLIVAFLFGPRAVTFPLVIASVLLAVLYALGGFIAVVRFESINQFLMPSVVIVTFLIAPQLAHFDVVPDLVVAWHPAYPAMMLMSEGSVLAGLSALAWSAIALHFARRKFQRFVVRA